MLAQTEAQLEEALGGIRPEQAGQIEILIAGLSFGEEKATERKRKKLSLISPSLSHVGCRVWWKSCRKMHQKVWSIC